MSTTSTTRAGKDEWLVGYLLDTTGQHSDQYAERLRILRNEKLDKPLITLLSGSCSQVHKVEDIETAIQHYLEDNQRDARLIRTACNGLCAFGPQMGIQLPGKYTLLLQKVDTGDVFDILDAALNYNADPEHILCQIPVRGAEPWPGIQLFSQLPMIQGQKRILMEWNGIINPEQIDAYIAHGGYRSFIKTIFNYPAARVCDLIEESGLRGRGGGGFPTGRKWKIALNAAADQKYLVCNADESDPGAYMDRELIEGNPHQVVEGIALAAYAIGASKAYIYLRHEYTLAIHRLETAVQQAKSLGLLGSNILDSGVSLNIQVVHSPGAFVCGEETALLNSMEGRRGMPRTKPPYPATRGLQGKPTVVNNVETLANITHIMAHGPRWFMDIGTGNSKGTKLFSLAGRVKYQGMVEVEMGTSLRDIVYRMAGGVKDDSNLKALHLGGPSGILLTPDELNTAVDYEDLKSLGAGMGSGGMIVLDEHACLVDTARFYMSFMQAESCGKCIPCREGSRRMLDILHSLTHRPANEAGHETLERFKGVMQLESLAQVMKDTSLCGLGQNAPNPLLSALTKFRDEFEEHIFDRKCRANVCRELRVFYIDVEKCTGCTLCARKCPYDAIIGSPQYPHFVVEEKCTGCGICQAVCKFSAVFIR